MAYQEPTAKYPSSKVTQANLLRPEKENVKTTLYADITAVSPGEGEYLRVNDASNFSQYGGVAYVNFSELIRFSGKGSDATSDYLIVQYRALPGGSAATSASAGDAVHEVAAGEVIKGIIEELVAIEAELGTGLKGTATDLAARLSSEHDGAGKHSSFAATTVTINSGQQDVDVTLVFDRTTGGSAAILWNGSLVTLNQAFKPNDLGVNRISATAPSSTFAGMVWLDTS